MKSGNRSEEGVLIPLGFHNELATAICFSLLYTLPCEKEFEC